jgi:hypothetical protein
MRRLKTAMPALLLALLLVAAAAPAVHAAQKIVEFSVPACQ